MSEEEYDLIVVGLGAMGSAVAYHASRLGLRVLGIDRHEPPHGLGSTKAETRITRLAVGEGPQYLPFVRRSHEIWRDLEVASGVDLLHECGGFIITEQVPVAGQRWEDFVTETAEIARGADIPFEIVAPAEARNRQPWITVADDQKVGFEPTAGLVMVEKCVEVQLGLAQQSGAKIHTNELVTAIEPTDDQVHVATSGGRYAAPNVVLATGPWIRDLAAPAHAGQISITRQVVYWFKVNCLSKRDRHVLRRPRRSEVRRRESTLRACRGVSVRQHSR